MFAFIHFCINKLYLTLKMSLDTM